MSRNISASWPYSCAWVLLGRVSTTFFGLYERDHHLGAYEPINGRPAGETMVVYSDLRENGTGSRLRDIQDAGL